MTGMEISPDYRSNHYSRLPPATQANRFLPDLSPFAGLATSFTVKSRFSARLGLILDSLIS